MISINLLPTEFRKQKNKFMGDGVFDIPQEVLIGIGGAFIIGILFLHAILGMFMILRLFEHNGLKSKWQAAQPEKQSIDQLLSELNTLRVKETGLQPLLGQNLLWAQKLNILSDVLPKGIWMRQLTYADNQLSIDGSAVSKSNDEMITVGNYVAQLKAEETFVQDFSQIDVGTIDRQEQQLLSVVDFTIKAQLKGQP